MRRIGSKVGMVMAVVAGTALGMDSAGAQTEVKPPSSTRPQYPPAAVPAGAGQTAQGPTTPQSAGAGGQQPAAQNQPLQNQPSGVPQSAAPVRYLGPAVTITDQVQQTAETTSGDLSRLRIEKWKMDSGSKQQAQELAQSVARNIQAALPEMLQQARAGQASLGAQFKLYHNLTALYETFATLTEAAGTFGPKQEYEPLARDLSALDQARHTLADYIQSLATQSDSELTRLRSQAQAAQQMAQQQKKVIVDDEQPKKPATKKKKAAQKPGEWRPLTPEPKSPQ